MNTENEMRPSALTSRMTTEASSETEPHDKALSAPLSPADPPCTEPDPQGRILIVEDDSNLAAGLKRVLEGNYTVETACTAEEGLVCAENQSFDVVVTDLQMPGQDGLELIRTLHPKQPELPIILITGQSERTDAAIEAIKLGAFDYVLKPINFQEFLKLIEKATANAAAKRSFASHPWRETAPGAIIGRSSAMLKVYKEIGRVAAKPVKVLIRGETGSGKELVARALHQHGDRANQPFVIVNCVAIPEALLESELFGHEQGAFTGAVVARAGKFEQAHHGTIFLDEIGDMSMGTQAKLLRVLTEKAIQRVGGKEIIPVDVRVIAATHRDLEEAVAKRHFREDLYHRLNDAVIHLPALRERRQDIPDLVRYFLHRHQPAPGHTPPAITHEAMRFLKYRAWPGNVRELKNVVQQAVVLARGYPIDVEILRRALAQASAGPAEASPSLQVFVAGLLERAESQPELKVESEVVEWVERQLYAQAIQLAEGDQSKVVKWLGVSRPTVRERLLHYGLPPAAEKTGAEK